MENSAGARAVEPKVKDQLPFSPAKQEAVLGHLLINRTFFLTCKDRIKPGWFAESLCQRIWTAMLDYYKQHELIPRPDTDLLQHTLIQSEQQIIRNACEAKITSAIHQSTLYHLKAIETELTDWMKARLFYEGVNSAAETWNRGHLNESYQILSTFNREIQDTVFHPDTAANFKALEPLFAQLEVDKQNALTFGCSHMDRLLLKGATGGSLLPGGTTIILGASDTGKTTTLITIACANILQGKSVLYLAHEGSMNLTQIKFLCCLLGESHDWLLTNYKNTDPVVQKRISRAQFLLDQFLVFVPYVKVGMTVEVVMSIIRRRQEERVVKTGKGFDLLIDDYAAKLSTEQAKGGKLEKRHKDEIVYSQFITAGIEYNFHHIGAIQTNREGSKINKGFKGYEERLLEMEDVAESMSVMMDAHCVISINRPPIAMAQNWITYHIAKSKNGETGWSVVCKSNFGVGRSHSEEMGAIWYRGTSSGSDRIGQLLSSYQNQAIPEIERI